MSSCRPLVLAAASLAALCAVGAVSASAGTRVEVVPSPVLAPNEMIVNVADYGYRYDRWRYGPRYTYPWGRYNNYYRGHYYASRWWVPPPQNNTTVIIVTPSNPGPVWNAPVVAPWGGVDNTVINDNTFVNNNTIVNDNNVNVDVNVNSIHIAWCQGRYYSYDPGSDTYLGNDGYRHLCRSPY